MFITKSVIPWKPIKKNETTKCLFPPKNCTFSQCYELNEIWFCWFIDLFRGSISYCISIWVRCRYMKLIIALAGPFNATIYSHANLSDLTKSFLCVPFPPTQVPILQFLISVLMPKSLLENLNQAKFEAVPLSELTWICMHK